MRKYVYYTVYLAKNDRVIAFGLAEDCAKMLGMNKATFFSTVSHAKKGDNGKYDTIIQLKRLNNPCRYDIISAVMRNEKVYFYKRGSARNQGCQRKEPG